MKRIFSALVALSALVIAKPLQADPWEGFYVGAFGGANFVNISKEKRRGDDGIDHNLNHNLRTGYYVGGNIGYRVCSGFRVEGEVSYRNNRVKEFKVDGERQCGRGTFRDISYMANFLYDIDTACWNSCWSCCGEIFPYIGAGIGYANQRIGRNNRDDVEFDFRTNSRKNGFAWQIIAGLGYDISCEADISIEYRFHKGSLNRVYNHGVGVAAKWHF